MVYEEDGGVGVIGGRSLEFMVVQYRPQFPSISLRPYYSSILSSLTSALASAAALRAAAAFSAKISDDPGC